MARNKGTFQFSANFQVKLQDLLDPRGGVTLKSELINKETFPYDGDTIYMKEGMLVTVQEEQSIYMLVDLAKITEADYSGWKRMDAGAASQVEVVDSLESDAADKALSAKQGKALKGEVDSLSQKLTKVYTYKGSKETFAELPAEGNAYGDVWNVAEAVEGHPAGTNWAWDGEKWDALGGSVDLSNYFNKDEVAAAIKVESDRAVAEEGRLAGLIDANTAAAQAAQSLADANKVSLESVTKSIGEINLLLNGADDVDTDGLTGRLAAVEGANSAQDTRLTNLEKLVSGGEAGEGGTTLLEMVNQNAADIEQLQKDVDAIEADYLKAADKIELQGSINTLSLVVGNADSGLVQAVNLLNADVNTAGSVDYKISQAFAWEDVE